MAHKIPARVGSYHRNENAIHSLKDGAYVRNLNAIDELSYSLGYIIIDNLLIYYMKRLLLMICSVDFRFKYEIFIDYKATSSFKNGVELSTERFSTDRIGTIEDITWFDNIEFIPLHDWSSMLITIVVKMLKQN